jgi:hypothetical protein
MTAVSAKMEANISWGSFSQVRAGHLRLRCRLIVVVWLIKLLIFGI